MVIRINSKSHDTLKELSEQAGKSMTALVSDAIELMRRRFILEVTNEAYRKAHPTLTEPGR